MIWVRRRLDRSRYEAIHDLLDQICEATFSDVSFELEQHRRVTLFKRKRFYWKRWPFFGAWLVPIERSGETTRRTDAVFRVHDDGEKCEGVAGRTYSKRKIVYVDSLPSLRTNRSDDDLKKYGEKSFTDPKRFRSNRFPQSCSLMGLPIEVDRKRWGVLVIDSINPSFSQKRAKQIFNALGPSLTSYLKGI